MREVYITRISNFLPNEGVPNDEMENFLGFVNNKPSRSKALILRKNKIVNRYYAIDKLGNKTHTNAEMVAEAVKNLFEKNPEEIKEIGLLSCGTSSPDQMMPSHGVMVHGYLPEMESIEVVSPSGVCCSGMHALKYAFMAIKCGETDKAVSTGSERLAKALRSEKYEDEVQKLALLEENPSLAFEKDFLRWMLSDGAGAFLLENKKKEDSINLKIDWIDAVSYANIEETCMYMAADKMEDGTLKSYIDFQPEDMIEQSVLSIKQDTKLLGEQVVPLGIKKLVEIYKRRGLAAADVDHFLPHISSFYFEDKIDDQMKEVGFGIPKEKWFINLDRVGNVGAGSIYLMLEELFNGGQLKKGEKILLMVPESSRFSYVYSLLTVC